LLDKVAILSGDLESNWFPLGLILKRLSHAMPKGEFVSLCKEYDLGGGTSNWLMSISQKFYVAKIPVPSDIPWRHLAVCWQFIKLSNCERVFRACRENSREELAELVRKGEFL
jgi:hypothetical protein